MDEIENKNSVLDSLDTLLDMTIEKGFSSVQSIINSDAVAVLKDLSDDTFKAVKVYKALKVFGSIPNILFCNKFEKYLEGIKDLSEKEKRRAKKKLNNKLNKKDRTFILEIINKTEDENKLPLYSKISSLFIDGEITNEEHKEFLILTQNTPYSVLDSLKKIKFPWTNTKLDEESFPLFSYGWLFIEGTKQKQGLARSSKKDPYEDLKVEIQYRFTSTAIKYWELVFSNSVCINK